MKKLVILVAGAALVLSAACSKPMSREDVVNQLKTQGIPSNMVDCVADGMIQKFGSDRLGQSGNLTPEEEKAATEIGTKCAMESMSSSTTAAP